MAYFFAVIARLALPAVAIRSSNSNLTVRYVGTGALDGPYDPIIEQLAKPGFNSQFSC